MFCVTTIVYGLGLHTMTSHFSKNLTNFTFEEMFINVNKLLMAMNEQNNYDYEYASINSINMCCKMTLQSYC